jgi:hypothetical protein
MLSKFQVKIQPFCASKCLRKHALNLVYFGFKDLLKLRYLWTLPCRKQCMMSSSFLNTTPISNFKSISLTVIEFWKRYHWNCWSEKIWRLRHRPKVLSYQIVFFLRIGLRTPFTWNVFFQHLFEDPNKQDDPQLLKFCRQLWICSRIIPNLITCYKK